MDYLSSGVQKMDIIKSEKTVAVLDARLLAAASYVRHGSLVADIGTDHGYLPIYLILNGVSEKVIVSDINPMPLKKAVENSEDYGVRAKIIPILSDGMDNIEKSGYFPDDIIICGMGGETIISIISSSLSAKMDSRRLIINPMTKTPETRKFLTKNGFVIKDEKLSKVQGKIYTCICAEGGTQTAASEEYSEVELILGRINIRKRDSLFEEYRSEQISRLKKQINGMKKGRLDTSKLEKTLKEIIVL